MMTERNSLLPGLIGQVAVSVLATPYPFDGGQVGEGLGHAAWLRPRLSWGGSVGGGGVHRGRCRVCSVLLGGLPGIREEGVEFLGRRGGKAGEDVVHV